MRTKFLFLLDMLLIATGTAALIATGCALVLWVFYTAEYAMPYTVAAFVGYTGNMALKVVKYSMTLHSHRIVSRLEKLAFFTCSKIPDSGWWHVRYARQREDAQTTVIVPTLAEFANRLGDT